MTDRQTVTVRVPRPDGVGYDEYECVGATWWLDTGFDEAEMWPWVGAILDALLASEQLREQTEDDVRWLLEPRGYNVTRYGEIEARYTQEEE